MERTAKVLDTRHRPRMRFLSLNAMIVWPVAVSAFEVAIQERKGIGTDPIYQKSG
jgi:hypothetical protein